MTWIDLVGIVLIIAYGVGGFFTGVVRRLIGFIAVYVALLAATNMGLQAGLILQQTSNFEVPDGRIYGFFGIVIAVLVIVEGATQLAHSQIQIPALALNRSLGVIVGVVTGVFLTVVCVYELGRRPTRSADRPSTRCSRGFVMATTILTSSSRSSEPLTSRSSASSRPRCPPIRRSTSVPAQSTPSLEVGPAMPTRSLASRRPICSVALCAPRSRINGCARSGARRLLPSGPPIRQISRSAHRPHLL